MLRKGLEPFPQNLQFCALPVELPKLLYLGWGDLWRNRDSNPNVCDANTEY